MKLLIAAMAAVPPPGSAPPPPGEPIPNVWYASTDNGGNLYPFIGDDYDAQAASVQALGKLMQAGQDAVTNGLSGVLDLGGVQVETAIGELFEANSVLQWGLGGFVSTVFDAATVQAAALWDVIADAGAALLLALA